jgi:hypothetical protein
MGHEIPLNYSQDLPALKGLLARNGHQGLLIAVVLLSGFSESGKSGGAVNIPGEHIGS